jgi:NADH-quinone oxidoreductase subunit H
MLTIVLVALVKIVLVVFGLMTAAAYLVLLERRMAAWIQDRRGPNRVGIPLTRIRMFGLGQPIADGVKFIFKEEFTPAHVDKLLYFLGPAILFVGAMAAFAVIPFGSVLPSSLGIEGVEGPIQLVIAPGFDVGIIYVFAVNGIAVYGLLLGSWASNSKYSFLGGLRSGAQLISYEIPMGLGILGVILMAGSLQLETIIRHQAETGVWNVLVQPLGFIVFLIAATAEATRLPFDLPEAEQELVGGYHTEYSGIKLMMYLVGEFLHLVTASFLIVILFFGGWHFWGLTGSGEAVTWPIAILRVVVLLAKVTLVILFFMVARWSWPRFRFDQLMDMAWKVMVPLGLANVLVVVLWIEYGTRVAEAFNLPSGVLMGVVGWAALVVTWLALLAISPRTVDNRPRTESLFALEDSEEMARS